MYIIIDLIRKKNEHHVFNSEIIKIFESINHNIYYLDKESSSRSIIKKKSKIYDVDINSSRWYFWVISTILLLKIISTEGKDKSYILLSATPIQYFLLSFLSKFFRVKISIFMHGELGYLKYPVGIGQKIGSFFINKAFNIKSNLNFIAINSYIYDNLKIAYTKTKFIHIEHPLQKSKKIESTKLNRRGMFFGSFGVQSTNKNSEKIYELSDLLSESFFLKHKLITVGVSDGTFKYDCRKKIYHMCKGDLNESLVPIDTFLKNVALIDFALFFNKNNANYDFTPSGVFSDCIAFDKPIIALKTNMLDSYFNRYGRLGFLCDDLNEMADVINSMDNKKVELEEIKANFVKIRNELSYSYYIKLFENL
ncbi:hypothetical protein HU985_17305 [Photobacterium damselae subsp. damselae]|uniref:hypothetical protein n=1 Tax=Photobacterium damselae TaxID=38293 RepID=UPI0015941588|nr:hypothetical protein [Photobacterium damselae]NVH52661.1 hypothetical protein [Photobacterium damselae subsp. damselae]NVO81659.1 hypothetical protein [Photobacterium damselae subsp. damselae]